MTHRFRVLLVTHSYPPVLGGSEIEAQRISGALIRRGHQVTVLCAGGAPMPDSRNWVDPAGVPVRMFGSGTDERSRARVFACGVAWTLLAERRNYDLVYFLMNGLHLATGLPTARLLGKPILMKVSGSGIITTMHKSRLGRRELDWLKKWAHRVMVLNAGMVEEALAAGFDRRQLYWMPNPVDVEEYAPCEPEERRKLRARLGVPPEAALVAFTGRLAPEKELASLLDGFALAAGEAPQAMLVLIGDGPERGRLEDKASRLGLKGRTRFTGRLTTGETREWLQASDAFALVSSNEGFSCALAEAMSAGLPSLVSDIPANAQLIDAGVHGVRAAVGDARSIADGLLCLLGDEALRRRMGAAARRRVVENYSTAKVVERYEGLFAAALKGC